MTAAWSEAEIRAAFAAVTFTSYDDGGYPVDRTDVDDLITELERAEEAKPKMKITIHPAQPSPPQVHLVVQPCHWCGRR